MKYYGAISWSVYGLVAITHLFFSKSSFYRFKRVLEINGVEPEIHLQ